MLNLKTILSTVNFNTAWYYYLDTDNLSFTQSEINILEFLNNKLRCLNNTQLYNLSTSQNNPIKFVPQQDLPMDMPYESFINNTGKIPTRDNYHDLLNGLIWLNFPNSKTIFNDLHACDIASNGIDNTRSPLRNALTLFDENGGLVVSCDLKLLESLQKFDWQTVFVRERAKWRTEAPEIAFVPFGHALLEKLITPRNNITSHTLLIYVHQEWFNQSIDAQRLQLDLAIKKIFLQASDNKDGSRKVMITSKNFQPLPVMGIPSYCQQNQQVEFYQDMSVFRLPRATKAPIFHLNEFI